MMTLEDLIKKVDRLEDEYKAMSTNYTSLLQRMKVLEDKSSSFLDTMKNLQAEFERVNMIFSKSGSFNESLMQVRADLTKRLDEIENQRQLDQNKMDEMHKDDFESLRALILETKMDIQPEIENKMKVFFEEDSRLVKKVEEMERGFHENLRLDQDFRRQFEEIVRVTNNNSTTLTSLEAEITTLIKLNSQIDTLNESIRLLGDRLTGIQNTETQRQKEHTTFMDQQIILQGERDRMWKEWTSQLEDGMQKLTSFLEEGQKSQFELKQTKDEFNEIIQGLSRRMNELTETYRIVEGRLRQEWETFRGDEQKRWANYSLTMGESQGSSLRQFQDMKMRLTSVEDRTQEMQEALMMISTEFQKGMQGLMKMVNNWIETFSDIRGSTLEGREQE